MEKGNNNSRYGILVGILCLVLGLLGGYIATDKGLLKEHNNTTNDESTTVNSKIDFNKLKDYGDINGGIKSFTDQYFSHKIINLSVAGKVEITVSQNDAHYITNLENIIDFVEFVGPYNDTIYFLSTEGDVYSYKLSDYDKNNFTATKENMSNMERIMKYIFKKEKGIYEMLIGINKNGETVILESSIGRIS